MSVFVNDRPSIPRKLGDMSAIPEPPEPPLLVQPEPPQPPPLVQPEPPGRPTLIQFAAGTAVLATDSLREITRGSARIARRLGSRGTEAMADSRDHALARLRSGLDGSVDWVATTVAPRLVDRMMPYLVSEAVPRIIDGAMPYVRRTVLPALIEDLTRDPEVREMISEQGRGVLTDATLHLREGSADADDLIETRFRKLFRLPTHPASQG